MKGIFSLVGPNSSPWLNSMLELSAREWGFAPNTHLCGILWKVGFRHSSGNPFNQETKCIYLLMKGNQKYFVKARSFESANRTLGLGACLHRVIHEGIKITESMLCTFLKPPSNHSYSGIWYFCIKPFQRIFQPFRWPHIFQKLGNTTLICKLHTKEFYTIYEMELCRSQRAC